MLAWRALTMIELPKMRDSTAMMQFRTSLEKFIHVLHYVVRFVSALQKKDMNFVLGITPQSVAISQNHTKPGIA